MIDRRAGRSPSQQQRAVMDHPLAAPAIVDAGAGTGKTFTIVERVAALHADPALGCPASKILLLTFSKKAAAELRGRVMRRLGPGVDPPECATFHAFALSVLDEHAFELRFSPDSSLINEIDARVEFWKTFDEFVRGGVHPGAEAFALRFFAVDLVRKALFDICQRLRDRGTSVDAFERRALAATDAFAKTPFRKLVKENARKATPVAEIDEADFQKEIEAERARVHAAAALFRAFDQRLRDRAALTYSDLLHLAIETIAARPEIARSLRMRYRHCIVDEYQDTDPRQIRLLAAIFGETFERVMVVGDPRQTIYGFRGIDPRNVAAFASKDGCVTFALTENRRSRQEILDLAHTVIKADFPDDGEPLRAVRDAAGSPVVHVASRWATRDDPDPDAARTREIEARWVAANVARLLSKGVAPRDIAILSRRKTQLQPLIDALNKLDVPFRQYGGAGYYEAPEILDARAWLRLVTDPLDDDAVARVLSSPGVGLSDASLVALCRGMREQGDHLARRALLGPTAGFDEDARERLDRFRRTIGSLDEYAGAPLVVAWEATIDRAGLMLTSDVRSGHRHDQARANLEKLSAMVRSFADRNPGSRASDFDRYIRELTDAEADDQEADPPAADAVTVMTIHAAKGLEWPIVFAIDIWPQMPSDNASVRLDDRTGALLVTEGGDGSRPFHTECVKQRADGDGIVPAEKERDPERDREERRLFYVALTRARDELFVSGRRKYSKRTPAGKAHDFLQETIEWVEQRGWDTLDEPKPDVQPYRRAGAGNASALPLGDFVLERAAAPAVDVPALSFSSISQFEQCPRSVTYRVALRLPGLAIVDDAGPVDDAGLGDDVEAVDLDGRLPRPSLAAAPYGDLVHRALELWARSPGRAAKDYVADAQRDLDANPSAAERERAATSVASAIAKLAGWEILRFEAPFTLDIDDVTVTGFIDLIAKDPSGDVTIVDYKTGVTEKDHYALQLALYRLAARRAYGLDARACLIARLDDAGCTFEDVELPGDEEVRKRIIGVAAGIAAADESARPGPHCARCRYRAAPCMDYPDTDYPM